MTPVFLLSDILLVAIMAAIIMIFVRSYRNPRLPQWSLMFKEPMAMVAGFLLASFGCIALLDSCRYESDFQVRTVLDLCLQGLVQKEGPSYAAPLTAIAGVDSSPLVDGVITALNYSTTMTGLILLVFWFRGCSCEQGLWQRMTNFIKGQHFYAWRSFFLMLWLISLVICIFYQWIAQYYIMGTDKLGSDILYQALKSIRTALAVGLLSTFLLLPCALFFGLLAGYFGSKVDRVITYIYSTIAAIPSILLITAAVLILQTSQIQSADHHLLILCLILGLTSWAGICRLVRAEVLKVQDYPFVQAVQMLGLSDSKILLQHVLPAVWPIALVGVTLDFSGLVLVEVALSYLGIGVGEGIYSFGTLMNNARMELVHLPVVWWPLLSAFSLVSLLMIAANFMSDVLQAFFDPTRRPQ